MTLGAFAENWKQQNRERLYNMLSFEFSHTPLMKLIHAPEIMYKLSWVNKFWSKEGQRQSRRLSSDSTINGEYYAPKPNVANFCLLGMAGSYTDFHIDFGGSSVWYHVYSGQKIFYIIQPNEEHFTLFSKWMASPTHSQDFFNELIPSKSMTKVVINPGETVLLPSGYIHSVYTPVDSIVFGGNFIHELNIARQLRVYQIEIDSETDPKFMFPEFEIINWLAAKSIIERTFEAVSPDIIDGYRVLLQHLKLWENREKKKNKNYKGNLQFPDVIKKLERMFKDFDKSMKEDCYDPKPKRKVGKKGAVSSRR
uniref:JmjC domain-containing protein n=1 Tax=Panagrolaimus sp. ES5 TaxID=591445 RepID=A0AC34FZF3_9BILA